jgi:hypothetical protein
LTSRSSYCDPVYEMTAKLLLPVFVIPEEVDRELNPSDDQPARWVHDHPQIHRSTAQSWRRAREVADRYPGLVNLAKPRGTADPFVVAVAIEERERAAASPWPRDVVVVANETSQLPSRRREFSSAPSRNARRRRAFRRARRS